MAQNKKAWEIHEEQCLAYLTNNFGQYATFSLNKGSDSTKTDIEVVSATQQFNVEVKLSPAQSGQFVVLDTGEEFQYSSRNKTPYNEYAGSIIEYMNQEQDLFQQAGTRGQNIGLPTELLTAWIQETYGQKGVEFFVTNDFHIVPIDDFAHYFNVTATYRVKRSGSSRVGKRRVAEVVYKLSELDDFEYFREEDNGAVFVKTVLPKNFQFTVDDNTYMLAPRGEEHEVRKLSNTNNANVIFSIVYNNHPGISGKEFIEFLTGS